MDSTEKIKNIRLIAYAFFASLVAYTIVVLVLHAQGFHGASPEMTKETILTLRTAFAGLSLFTFFPIVWALNRRNNAADSVQWTKYTFLLFAFAESPAIYGLMLFLLKSAFKTFFAFLILSFFYQIIVWPRSPSYKK